MRWAASTLKAKIIASILVTQFFSLSVGFLVVGVQSHHYNKSLLKENSLVYARLVAMQSLVPLTFEDKQATIQLLSRLEIKALRQTVVYDKDKEIFAQYQHAKTEENFKPHILPKNVNYGAFPQDNKINIYQAIGDINTPSGYVFLQVSTDSIVEADVKMGGFLFVLAIFLLLLSYFIAMKLETFISKPILELAMTSVEVSQTQDYSIRARRYSDDEIGQLTQNFNKMLEAISVRQQERDEAEKAFKEKKEQLESAIHELQHLANFDRLTKLPNRTLSIDSLRTALLSASRDNKQVAILILCLDDFNGINDSLGHNVGDELLIAVARHLNTQVEERKLARIGGDEFMILYEQLPDVAALEEFANKIVKSFEGDFELSNCSVRTTISIGMSIFPQHGMDVSSLMRNADIALYRAKESFNNSFAYYEHEMKEKISRRTNLSTELRKAVLNNQMALVYQPKYQISTTKITGVEVLLRWHHPNFGTISPGEFIPIAESTGMIYELGMWLLERACMELKAITKRGPLQIAFNLSPVQLRDLELPDKIEALVNKYELSVENFVFEIPESALVKNLQYSLTMLERLKAKGFKIALDDFGTAYTSFNHLKHLQLDVLKIDQSLVKNLVSDETNRAIAKAVIDVAKAFGLIVVAECVEKEEQIQFLSAAGCEEVQGFYFSPGVEVASLERVLTQNQQDQDN